MHLDGTSIVVEELLERGVVCMNLYALSLRLLWFYTVLSLYPKDLVHEIVRNLCLTSKFMIAACVHGLRIEGATLPTSVYIYN